MSNSRDTKNPTPESTEQQESKLSPNNSNHKQANYSPFTSLLRPKSPTPAHIFPSIIIGIGGNVTASTNHIVHEGRIIVKAPVETVDDLLTANVNPTGISIVIDPPKENEITSESPQETSRGRSLNQSGSRRHRSHSASAIPRLERQESAALEIRRSKSPHKRDATGFFSPTTTPEHSPTHSPIRSPATSRKGIFRAVADTVSNYTNLHELLINSPLLNKQKTITYPEISNDDMLDTNVDDLDDNQQFQVGFAHKVCIPNMVTHASLAFRNPNTDKFLVIGRQNEEFLKEEYQTEDQKNQKNHGLLSWLSLPTSWLLSIKGDEESYWKWLLKSMADPQKLWHFTETKMGNEKQHIFFPGYLFTIEMSEVILTGAEIKALVKKVNDDICSCKYDLIHSNCYSAVFYGLAQAIKIIADRNNKNEIENKNFADEEIENEERKRANNKDLKRLFTLICLALKDNHQLGLGALNNSMINEAITSVIQLLEQRKLLVIKNPEAEATVKEDANTLKPLKM